MMDTTIFPKDRPYTKVEAYIDYHIDKIIIRKDNTLDQYAKKWLWSRSSVFNFIKFINSEQFWDKNETLYKLVNSQIGYTEKTNLGQNLDKENVKLVKERAPVKKKKERTFVYGMDTFRGIIDYLNEKTGRKYGLTDSHLRHLRARLNDGYTPEDCKKVIDIKCAEWLTTDMNKYLRPETLFGNKFDSYLNQGITKITKNTVHAPNPEDTEWSKPGEIGKHLTAVK